jgi:hypothetical protein
MPRTRTPVKAHPDEMTPVATPAPYVHPQAGWDSRLNIRNNPDAYRRRNMLPVWYLGRRTRSGQTLRTPEEHIDVQVPDEGNQAAVERYLDPILPVGLDPEQAAAVEKEYNATTLILSGQGYHFICDGTPSDVYGEDWDWLQKHPVYVFSEKPPGWAPA